MDAKSLEPELVAYGRTLPEAFLDHPWGHDALKVRGKAFCFLGGGAGAPGELSMTVKLPVSAEMALTLPGVEPAGYGLGRAGWVTVRRSDAAEVDPDLLKGWMRQSYRAIAPKRLAALVPV